MSLFPLRAGLPSAGGKAPVCAFFPDCWRRKDRASGRKACRRLVSALKDLSFVLIRFDKREGPAFAAKKIEGTPGLLQVKGERILLSEGETSSGKVLPEAGTVFWIKEGDRCFFVFFRGRYRRRQAFFSRDAVTSVPVGVCASSGYVVCPGYGGAFSVCVWGKVARPP